MSEININPDFNPKQLEALRYLTDKTTRQVLFGGAAAGGKSFLGCAWITMCSLKYPGTRYLIGRSVLKTLKLTTLQTLFEVFKQWGIIQDLDFTYHEQISIIKFSNQSEIILKDLADNPSDPEWQSLGSLELTAAFIDEGGEISQKAFDVLSTRIRYKLKDFDLIPKLLITTNPTHNFLYHTFYLPFKEQILPEYKKFIQSLLVDNKYISPEYEKQLSLSEDVTLISRLRDGNWDYATDNTSLIPYDKILYIFRQAEKEITSTTSPTNTKYITADIAGSGNDKTVIMVWENYRIKDIKVHETNTTTEAIQSIKNLATKYNVFARNIIVDKVGLGTGVYDGLQGCYGFVANAKAVNPDIYANLKTECGYKFASLVNTDKIMYSDCPFEYKELIIKELEQLKSDIKHLDSKKQLMSKDDIKKAIKRSPDFLDCLIFRAYFDIAKRGTGKYAVGGF